VIAFDAISTKKPVSSLAAIASQLPDIDTTESFSGRLIWPLTNYLEQRFPHRSFPHRSLTHSFMATGIVAGLAAPPANFETYPTIRVNADGLELQNTRPQELLAVLREFWILQGSILIKVKL
jgi:hypothetical protein